MKSAGIGGVYLVVEDMDRAQRFYESALGLITKFRDRSSWCQFDTGSVSFSLSSPEEADGHTQGAVVVFKAKQVASVQKQIEDAGGSLIGLREMGSHGTVVTFEDPEKNRFQVLFSNETQPG